MKQLIKRLLSKQRRARTRKLVARYEAAADGYGSIIAADSELHSWQPVPPLEYLRILEFVYRSHAEEVRKLL